MSEQENTRISLITTITRVVREATGLHERFSCEIATSVVDELGRQYGCERLYIPALPKNHQRSSVLRDFNGSNVDEVCTKHGIHRATLYRYLSECNEQTTA
jgi:hypothetical protein